MPYEKQSETQLKVTETKQVEKVYNITDLKNDRAIYVAQIAEYQAKIDEVDVLLSEASKLGIAEQAKVVETLEG